jgi:hypothetical protein
VNIEDQRKEGCKLRTIEMRDGKDIVERLEAIDDAKWCYRYTNIAGIPASHVTGTLDVTPNGSGSVVTWRVQFSGPAGVRRLLSSLIKTGLDSLKCPAGVAK